MAVGENRPAGDPADAALGDHANRFGIGVAFGGEHAGGQGVGRIVGKHGNGFLEDDGAVIVLIVAIVDGASAGLATRGEHGFVDPPAVKAGAAEIRQQGGVNVDDAAGEMGGYPPERKEAGHADEVGAVHRGVDFILELLFGECSAIHDHDGQTERTRPFDAGDVAARADHAEQRRGKRTFGDALVQVDHGPAAAGDQDGQTERDGREETHEKAIHGPLFRTERRMDGL